MVALAFPPFLSIGSGVSETCLGRRGLLSLILLAAFHRFRGFLRANENSLRGGHSFQAWQPFSSAPSSWR